MRQQAKTTEQLHREWLGHPHFKYRGCAPDADDPLRMAGDPGLPVGAHHGPDAFAPEGQRERRAREAAAVEVCVSCPVMVACDRYASSVKADGRLAEPDGVWGGRLARERKRLFDGREEPAAVVNTMVKVVPQRRLETPQKLAILRALAMCWDPFAVAAAAGVDVRTANWQRSRIVTDMGLPKSASRERMLAVAVERGLVDASLVVLDGGLVPAVPPPTKTTERPAPVVSVASVVPVERAAEGLPRALRPRRRRVAAVRGQLSLFDESAQAAAVTALYPSNRSLEAAA